MGYKYSDLNRVRRRQIFTVNSNKKEKELIKQKNQKNLKRLPLKTYLQHAGEAIVEDYLHGAPPSVDKKRTRNCDVRIKILQI